MECNVIGTIEYIIYAIYLIYSTYIILKLEHKNKLLKKQNKQLKNYVNAYYGKCSIQKNIKT